MFTSHPLEIARTADLGPRGICSRMTRRRGGIDRGQTLFSTVTLNRGLLCRLPRLEDT